MDAIDRPALARKIYSPEYDIKSALASEKQEPTLEEYQEIEDNVTIIGKILEEVLQGKLERRSSGSIVFKDESLNESVSIANHFYNLIFFYRHKVIFRIRINSYCRRTCTIQTVHLPFHYIANIHFTDIFQIIILIPRADLLYFFIHWHNVNNLVEKIDFWHKLVYDEAITWDMYGYGRDKDADKY